MILRKAVGAFVNSSVFIGSLIFCAILTRASEENNFGSTSLWVAEAVISTCAGMTVYPGKPENLVKFCPQGIVGAGLFLFLSLFLFLFLIR
jgi:hypothetical protein